MKRIIWLSAALLALAGVAGAGGPGTTGASFLKVGVGARELALGSAASSLTEGANSVNWNPAGLAGLKTRDVSASYNMLFIDESQGFLGYAAPVGGGSGVFGIGVNYLTVRDIEKRASDTDSPDSKFNNNNTAATISYARAEVRPGLAVGGNVKYVEQKLDSQSDKAVALDLGTAYAAGKGWTAAFVVQNLGGRIGPDRLPLTLKGGASRRFLDGKLAAAADVDWLVYDERAYLDLGGEYTLGKYLALRAGYQFGRGADDLGSGLVGLGAGVGIRYESFKLDYAYVPFGDLGDTHRMTFGFVF